MNTEAATTGAGSLERLGSSGGYGFSRTLSLPFDEVREKVTATLKAEGFGVLTEIDLKQKLKEKLGVDFRNYLILGACNPPIAHRVLGEELAVGLLLPCNVIIYSDNDSTIVAAVDAEKMMSVVGNPNLEAAASEVNEKLKRALANIR
jgi:uncharacterized protein (DUF302 family)